MNLPYRPNPPLCSINEETLKLLQQYCKPFPMIERIVIEDNSGDAVFSINDGEYQIEVLTEEHHDGPGGFLSTAFLLTSHETNYSWENPPEDDVKELKVHCLLDEIVRVMMHKIVDNYIKELAYEKHLDDECEQQQREEAADDGVSL